MNTEDFEKWNACTSEEQIQLFREQRKVRGLTQEGLGEKLKIYGYTSGRKNVENWEQGRAKIPLLVFELLSCDFNPRLPARNWRCSNFS